MCCTSVSTRTVDLSVACVMYLANDVHSAWTSADKIRRLAVCTLERREEVVPSCGLRLESIFGVDVGERRLVRNGHVVPGVTGRNPSKSWSWCF